MQEAFLQIWRNAGRFDARRGSPRAWMIGVLRYRALDRLNHEARHFSHGELPDLAEEMPVSVEDRGALADCLRQLPETSRQCLLLSYVEGMSHPEISTTMAKPLGTVKSWITRGLAALKLCLEQ